MINVRESAEFIALQSRHVRVHQEKITEIAGKIVQGAYAFPTAEQDQSFIGKTAEQTARWCLMVDAVNFCFWPDKGAPLWEVHDAVRGDVSGYWALASSMARSANDGTLPLDLEELKNLSLGQTQDIFRGKGEIPLLAERHHALVEIGEGLFGDSVLGLIDETDNDAALFLEAVISRFPSFRDEAVYEGRHVGLYKRAQLLISDLSLALGVHGVTPFRDLSQLTAFADYKIPQLLRAEGALEYDEALSKKVDSLQIIPAGSPEEVEIRGVGVVYAVEVLKKELFHRGMDLPSWKLDNILWTESKRPERTMAPHHRTRTIFY